jgi:hypothetical protein
MVMLLVLRRLYTHCIAWIYASFPVDNGTYSASLSRIHHAVHEANCTTIESYRNSDGTLKTITIMVDGSVLSIPLIEANPPNLFKVTSVSIGTGGTIDSMQIEQSIDIIAKLVRQERQKPWTTTM